MNTLSEYKEWLQDEYKKSEKEWHKHKNSLEASIYETKFEALHMAWLKLQPIDNE